jgi:hypothetical protein
VTTAGVVCQVAPDLEPLLVPIDQVRTHPRNKREGDVGAIAELMRAHGLYAGLVVQRSTGYVLAGNHRLRAAHLLGWTHVPVVWLDVDDRTARTILISDNRASDLASWDRAGLADELRELAALGSEVLALTGFTGDDLDDLITDLAGDGQAGDPDDEQPAADPDPEAEPETLPGVVVELGRHRLICGDAFDAETRDLLLDGVTPGAIITDPPYGMNLDTAYADTIGKRTKPGFMLTEPRSYRPVIGDDRPFDARPLVDAYGHVAEQFWFGADYYRPTLSDDPTDGSWLVWDKRNDESDDVFGSGFELIWSRKRHQRRLLRHFQIGAVGADGAREHPTQKPARLYADVMTRWTPAGAAVLDPFAGVGPALFAAEQTGRTAYLIELDPRYCDVIRRRWADRPARG